MTLSFKEKRDVLKDIASCFEQLLKPDLGFREKRALLKQIADDFARLGDGVPKTTDSLLDRLLAGEFLDSDPAKFIGIVQSVVAELNNAFEPVVQPVIDYVGRHASEADFAEEVA